MRLIVLFVLLAFPVIGVAQQSQTSKYKRDALQAENYPDDLRSTACLISARKDVAIVDELPTDSDEGEIVLLAVPDAGYLFKRESKGWRMLTKFPGKWEKDGYYLERGPCSVRLPAQ